MYRIFMLAMTLAGVAGAGEKIGFQAAPGHIDVTAAGRPFATFYDGHGWPQPFLHGLRASTGQTVTRAYPVEQTPGESIDHNWHHGLWWAHGDINGVDFWRDKGAQTTGRIVLHGKLRIKRDTISGLYDLVTPAGETLGTVEQSFHFAVHGALRIVDVQIIINADHKKALKFGDTEEGALGIRLRDEFREDRGTAIINSEGASGTRKVWGQRAAWVDYSSKVEDQALGVAIFDHPANPKHPTFWHARGYGLCAANPFGEHDFMKDKTRDGSLTLDAEKTMTFRYRVVVHPGAGDPALIKEWYGEWARTK